MTTQTLAFRTRDEVVDWLERSAEYSLDLFDGAVLFQSFVTPDVAQAILRLMNDKNPRKMKYDSVANRYAADMSAGKWRVSYEPLVFEGDEFSLVNGQNRLRAVVKAGIGQRFVIVCYAASEAKCAIDTHSPRNISATHGIDAGMAAACRIIRALETGETVFATREQVVQVMGDYDDSARIVATHASKRKPTRRADFRAAFMIALQHAEDRRGDVLALLEDISSLTHATEASRTIVKHLEQKRSSNHVHDRLDVALCVLQGIVCHLEGAPRQILRPTVRGLRWFLPNSRLRTEAESAILRAAFPDARHKAAAE